jgi:hypothetical protein
MGQKRTSDYVFHRFVRTRQQRRRDGKAAQVTLSKIVRLVVTYVTERFSLIDYL